MTSARRGAGAARRDIAAQREVRHERDRFALAEVDDILVFALADVVTVLNRRDRDDPTGLLDLLHADLGETYVPDRATVDVGTDGAQALLERRLGVHAVQVVQADRLAAKRAQALLDLPTKDVRPALACPVAALGGDEHVLTASRERHANCALALTAAVEMRGIHVPHARRNGLTDERHMIGGRREPVGPEAYARHIDSR